MNPDGTPMTTEHFVKAIDEMNKTNKPAAIGNFGLNQSSLEEQRKHEDANKQVK